MPLVAIDASDARTGALRGWGRYVAELVGALDPTAEGFELTELASGGGGLELAWEQWGLPRALRRIGADLVHSTNCFLPLRRPCPGVVTVHDLAFEAHPGDFSRRTGAKYRLLTPRAVRSAQRVIAVSAFTAGDLVRRYGLDEQKLRVIHPAPSLAHGGGGEPPAGPYILAAGDLRAKKNFVRLAEAYAALRREGLPHRLVIAGGEGGESERIRAAAAGEPVELPGYLPDAELDALMRGAELFVHPSLYEGFGLVVVEAMARGVPVAAARATALPEAAGGAAELFDPLDAGDIAAAIRRVLGDSARRAELAEAGRRRASELSWQRTAAETAVVYRELL